MLEFSQDVLQVFFLPWKSVFPCCFPTRAYESDTYRAIVRVRFVYESAFLKFLWILILTKRTVQSVRRTVAEWMKKALN